MPGWALLRWVARNRQAPGLRKSETLTRTSKQARPDLFRLSPPKREL
jgi:hypothetical protein